MHAFLQSLVLIVNIVRGKETESEEERKRERGRAIDEGSEQIESDRSG